MNTTQKIVKGAILLAIITFLILSYVGTKENRTQIGNLDSLWTEKTEQNEKNIDANAAMIETNTDLIDKNTNLIDKNVLAIEKFSKAHQELANIVYAHGRKINRVVWELVFRIAYGDTEKARTTWNQYCKCTNLPLWKDAVSKLNEKQVEKILKINEIEQKIAQIDTQINPVNP